MALAEFHSRSALAAAQVLDGFDEEAFRSRLERVPAGVAFGADCLAGEGRALLDLLIRLLARLYPTLEIRGHGANAAAHATELRQLALAINPVLEFAPAVVGVVVGAKAEPFARSVFAGASGWDALVSSQTAQPVGRTANPFGAGAAACIATANLFRLALLPDGERLLDDSIALSTLDLEPRRTEAPPEGKSWDLGEAVLIGVGAIGNATVWALSRSAATGTVHLVDHETIELSNLQRYVLAMHRDIEHEKTEVAARSGGAITWVPESGTWQQFVSTHGYAWETVAIGVDNAPDRVAVQASLPKRVLNAWTQPGDLGLSAHPHFGAQPDACLACLYLPTGVAPNEDEIVARALGIPERLMDVRQLLHSNGRLERPLIEAVAGALKRPVELVAAFEGRPIRELYVRGVCGGAVIPIGEAGRPRQDVHVPLAHQSALAGVLLAAQMVRLTTTATPDVTTVTTIDLMRPLSNYLTLPRQRHETLRCICGDQEFVDRYELKWATPTEAGTRSNRTARDVVDTPAT